MSWWNRETLVVEKVIEKIVEVEKIVYIPRNIVPVFVYEVERRVQTGLRPIDSIDTFSSRHEWTFGQSAVFTTPEEAWEYCKAANKPLSESREVPIVKRVYKTEDGIYVRDHRFYPIVISNFSDNEWKALEQG